MKRNPSPPTYQFKPLHCHFDEGFGAVGDSFHEAAIRLERAVEQEPFINSLLPLAYLYRHAVELYLKSVIIILHRSFKLPFGTRSPSDKPAIKVSDEWVPINRVHGVAELYEYFDELMSNQMGELLAGTSTDWKSFPRTDLRNGVSLIDRFDEKSTLFRYPGVGDADKSEFRESSIAEIFASLGIKDDPVKAYIESDDKDQVVSVFCRDSRRLNDFRDVLRKTADLLSTLHFALRCELAEGT
jgi:hypothetical protein